MSGAARTLGGLALPDDLQWVERGQAAARSTVTRRALDGQVHLFHAPAVVRVTLLSGQDHGWFSRAQAQDLLALANAALSVDLVWHDALHPTPRTWRVAFDHEAGAAVDFSELWPGCEVLTGRILLVVLEEV